MPPKQSTNPVDKGPPNANFSSLLVRRSESALAAISVASSNRRQPHQSCKETPKGGVGGSRSDSPLELGGPLGHYHAQQHLLGRVHKRALAGGDIADKSELNGHRRGQ
jgi:hypothetical protein